jgi:hypothetical protein
MTNKSPFMAFLLLSFVAAAALAPSKPILENVLELLNTRSWKGPKSRHPFQLINYARIIAITTNRLSD